MKLIVGLGNPEKRYEKTRHNCGFRAIDYYAKENNLTFKSKFKGLYCEQVVNNEKIILLKPQTYMNLSGESVREIVNFYNIDINDILVIYDDVDFEVGTFKIRRGGSAGGHNGIRNIIDNLKTEIPLMDYVLGKFTPEEDKKIESILPQVANIINDFSNHNIDELMEKYNRNKNE